MKLKGHETFTLFAATVAALLLASTPGHSAQNTCAARDRVLERLATHYGEERQSIALGQNQTVVEVFASPATGSWTITVTSPNGTTCMVASGQAYEATAQAPKPDA